MCAQESAELAGHSVYLPSANPVRIRLALECPGLVWSSRRIVTQSRNILRAIKDLQEVVVNYDGADVEHGEDTTRRSAGTEDAQRIPFLGTCPYKKLRKI